MGLTQTPGKIQKVAPPWGSLIYTIEASGARMEGSTSGILQESLGYYWGAYPPRLSVSGPLGVWDQSLHPAPGCQSKDFAGLAGDPLLKRRTSKQLGGGAE